MQLKEKVAIVTGGAQGIGKAICYALELFVISMKRELRLQLRK